MTKLELISNNLSGEQREVGSFHFQWHITEKCNLRCKHCYVNEHVSYELSTDEAIKTIVHLAEVLKCWGCKGSVSLTGGEPLLRSDFKDIVYTLRGHEQFESILVMTNGVQISDDTIEFLRDNHCSVQTSIDGLNKEQHDEIRGKGNFNRTVSTTKRLSNFGIKTNVHFVAHKSNYPTSAGQLKSFFNLLQDAGVNGVTFSLLVPIGRGKSMKDLLLTPNEVKVLFQWLKEVSKSFPALHLDNSRPLWVGIENCSGGVCPAGFRICAILPNGDVLPCRRLPIVLGNIRRQSFFEIWYKSDILWQLRKRKKIDHCGECGFLDQCAGCRAMAYAVSGNFMAKDPLCFVCSDHAKTISKT